MTKRVLIAEPDGFCDAAVRILEGAAEVELRQCDRSVLSEAFAEYDAVWLRLAQRIDGDLLGAAPRCKVLAAAVTGLDHIDLEACAERGVKVVSLKGEAEFLREVRATAELAIGLAMALMRRIPAAAESVKSGVWNRDLFVGRELYKKTAGVVGMGRLGAIVAEYFTALGMRVIGYDPRDDFPEVVQRVDTLDTLLRQSDVVSIHAVLDEGTRGLIGRAELAAMRPGAVLVNTSRGGIVDEAALLDALESGRLSGAALDVLATEPEVSADDPLITYARAHDNLLIVPHIGGKTLESMEKTEVFIAERVIEALSAN